MPQTAEKVEKTSFLQRFSGVDFVSIALFAVLLRFVFLYIYKALYVVFPWNQAIFPAFQSVTMACLMVVVPKKGTILLWTITWQLINMFMQGEIPLYVFGSLPIPIIAELVIAGMSKAGKGVDSPATIFAASMVYTLGFKVWDYIALNWVYLIPYPLNIALIVTVISVVASNNVGAYIGLRFGKRLKTLIG